MNLTNYTDGLVGIINISSPGATMTGFLSLSVETGDANYLIRKEYADLVFSALDASSITTAPVNISTIKDAVSGDVIIKTDGTTSINVSIPAVTATKVTVNDKGIVTATSSLVEADIPSLDWSIITSGKPTTAGGYGIGDALYNTGGTVTGDITLAADPVANTDATTKGYVDAAVTAKLALGVVVGDIIIKLPSPVPTGFLRCNGGYVSRTTYATLYATLGSSFNHPTDATLFALPDLTLLEVAGYGYYVKY